jgi:two-component system, NarL family, nitrate/nitrite response regulator NarL
MDLEPHIARPRQGAPPGTLDRGVKTTPPLRVVLIDRQPMFRSGLRFELGRLDDCVVLGEAAGIQDLLLLLPHNPDLLLLHADDVFQNTLDLLRDIDRAGYRLKTLLVSDDGASAATAVAVRLGVIGVLPTTVDATMLRRCIDGVRGGECWFRRDSFAALIEALNDADDAEPTQVRPFGLTRREFEVVLAVAEGLSNREIASRLTIREDTVKHHLSAAFDKTGTFSRVELAVFALNHRLTAGRPRRSIER